MSDPAFAALVAVVRARIDPSWGGASLAAVVDAADPAALLALAEEHRLMPLLARVVRAPVNAAGARADAVHGPGARAELDLAVRRHALNALAALPLLRALLDALRDAGIPALAWKGPALAVQAWDDVASRAFVDLDIVVAPRDRRRAREVVRAIGWRPRHAMSDAQEDVIFAGARAWESQRDDSPLLLELHWAFGARRYAGQLDVEEVIARAVTIDVGGVRALVPAPADALVLLAVHATKHGWSSLEDVAVFAKLVHDEPAAVREAVARARRSGGERAVRLGLALAARVFGVGAAAPMPGIGTAAPVLGVGTAPGLPALERQVQARWEAGHTAWRSTLRWDLAWTARLRDKGRLVLHSTFDPTLQEWNAVRLPAALGSFYRVLRPLRLLMRPLRR